MILEAYNSETKTQKIIKAIPAIAEASKKLLVETE